MDKSEFDMTLKQICTLGSIAVDWPIEEMLKSLELAETLGPFADPTLYREYQSSAKAQAIKPLLESALRFKKAVATAQLAELTERKG